MSLSTLCKEHGLSPAQLSEITAMPERTLRRWSRERPELLRIVLLGAEGFADQIYPSRKSDHQSS